MTRYKRERTRADSIVHAVLDDLSGRADFRLEILDDDPDSVLCIGVLTPPPPEGDPTIGPRRTKRKPDSLGLDARVQPDADTVAGAVDVSFLVYHRVVPTLAEQRGHPTGPGKQSLRAKYRRSKISIEKLPFSVSVPPPGGIEVAQLDSTNDKIVEACRAHAAALKADSEWWPSIADDIKVEQSDLSDEASYRAAIAGTAGELAKWIGRLEVTLAATSDGYRLSLLFSNGTIVPAVHPTPFFDVQLKVALTRGKLVSKEFAAAALDYRYKTKTYGHGINAVLKVDETNETIAIADTTPLHFQQRLTSREIGLAASASALAGDGVFDSLDEIEAYLRSYAERWKKFISDHAHDPDISAESPKILRCSNKRSRPSVSASHVSAKTRGS